MRPEPVRGSSGLNTGSLRLAPGPFIVPLEVKSGAFAPREWLGKGEEGRAEKAKA